MFCRNINLDTVALVPTPAGHVLKVIDFTHAASIVNNNIHLTGICGKLGFLPPEMFVEPNHSLPVDMWSLGILTYVLLEGHTPFPSNVTSYLPQALQSPQSLAFVDNGNGCCCSIAAKEFVRQLLQVDPSQRLTASQALNHPWVRFYSTNNLCSIIKICYYALPSLYFFPSFFFYCFYRMTEL